MLQYYYMKYTLIFLDTETTGNTEEDFLCQVAYKVQGQNEIKAELFLPPVKIPPEASAVSHITNIMVADKPKFQGSLYYEPLKNLIEQESSILVAHNATFDIGMLKKENIETMAYIDTMRVAKHLDKDGVIPRYNLQFLRYYLEIEIEAQAHDAKGDVIILEELYNRLFQKIRIDTTNDDEAVERMIELSSKPCLVHKFYFGKYKDQKVADVAKSDRGYLEWLYNQKDKEETKEKDEDWLFTLRHYLGILQ